MVSVALCCCVIVLPLLVLGQSGSKNENPADTAIISERNLIRSEKGWIGCIYNPRVCEDNERCYDDNLFGVCRLKDSGISASMLLYNYKDLSTEWKRLLVSELTKLAEQGFKWTDVFTQCILRSTLLAYRSSSITDATICYNDLDQTTNRYTQPEEDDFAIEEPRGSLLANEETRNDALRRMEEEVEKEKRDAALRLHKYFADDVAPDYEEEGSDYVSDNDILKFRQQLENLRKIQKDAQANLDNDSVDDLKSEESDEIEPQNEDLKLEETLNDNKLDNKDNRQTKRSQGLGHARMKSYAKNVSPEEALGRLRPSKRYDHHSDRTNAEEMREAAEQEADLEEEKAAKTTAKPKKIVDSRWVYVILSWPKDGPQEFSEADQVEQFLDAIKNAMGIRSRIFDKYTYNDREVDFRLTKQYQENSQAFVARLENVTEPLKGGPTIIKIGFGRATRKVSAARLAPRPKHFGVTFAVCGAVLFIIVAVIIVFFMQRYRISKSKLYSITKSAEQGESREAYQDLCRHRMQSKSNEKPEPVSAAARAVGPALTRGDSNSAGSTRSSTSSWSEEPIHSNMDISTGHLILSYMEEHLNNKEKLESEWNNLCAYQPDCVKCDIGKREENLNRNRYLDNIPYDTNRVELKTAFEGSNYFNASYVINHDPKNPVYIVTQGPLANTAAQFWQMIWEQGSIVIVNLTRLVEDGISLCQKYWPEEGSELYNNYEVHLVSEHVWCEDYLVRSFYLKNVSSGETRTVTQFHFLSWPDLGEPAAVKTLLDFRRKVNKSYKGRSCPVVVHCSDGCGRSGTYILLDMVLNRLAKGVKQIDISAAVEHLRDQRCQMVKTKGQFEFVLTAIAEEVHAMLKSLPQ